MNSKPGETRIPGNTGLNRIINLDKPVGIGSNAVLSRIKKVLGIKKAGFIGTLDPLASGILPVFTGKMTKLIEYFSGTDKEYLATLEFGKNSPSLDYGSEVTETPFNPFSEDQARQVLDSFLGKIRQEAPIYSALKVNGKPMYEYARGNIPVQPKTREVSVLAIELLETEGKFMRIRVRCSTGTYIRSLARDIGAALGNTAILAGLRRVNVGDIFRIEEAVSPEMIENTGPENSGLYYPISKLIIDRFWFEVSPDMVEQIIHGKPVEVGNLIAGDEAEKQKNQTVFALDARGNPVATGFLESSRDRPLYFAPSKVLA